MRAEKYKKDEAPPSLMLLKFASRNIDRVSDHCFFSLISSKYLMEPLSQITDRLRAVSQTS